MKTIKLSPSSFLAISILVCLVQVLFPRFFLTGDGPCHVYNAKLFHDYMTNENQAYYSQFYTLLKQPNPNWFTTVIISCLMFLFSPEWSEKILISIYIILFIIGFSKLIKIINPNIKYLVLLTPILVFNTPLFKGFYNYSISVALFLWLSYFFFNYLKTNKNQYLIFISFLSIITFFAHPLGVIYFFMIMGSFILINILYYKKLSIDRKYIIKLIKLCLGLMPVLLFMFWFYIKQGSNNLKIQMDLSRIKDLIQLTSLVTHNENEALFASLTAFSLITLFILSFYYAFIKLQLNEYFLAFLLSLIIIVTIYFGFPDWLFGGGILIIRIQIIFYLFIILVICSINFSPAIDKIGAFVLLSLFFVFGILRFNSILQCSEGMSNIMEAKKFINPNSTILNFNYAPNGVSKTENSLANRSWLFIHEAGYIAANKSSILLDNYEANTGYFPFKWNDEINPYHKILSIGDGIEGHPPNADIEAYNKIKTIDYILVWGFENKYLEQENTAKLWNSIKTQYDLIFATADKRTLLYKFKNKVE